MLTLFLISKFSFSKYVNSPRHCISLKRFYFFLLLGGSQSSQSACCTFTLTKHKRMFSSSLYQYQYFPHAPEFCCQCHQEVRDGIGCMIDGHNYVFCDELCRDQKTRDKIFSLSEKGYDADDTQWGIAYGPRGKRLKLCRMRFGDVIHFDPFKAFNSKYMYVVSTYATYGDHSDHKVVSDFWMRLIEQSSFEENRSRETDIVSFEWNDDPIRKIFAMRINDTSEIRVACSKLRKMQQQQLIEDIENGDLIDPGQRLQESSCYPHWFTPNVSRDVPEMTNLPLKRAAVIRTQTAVINAVMECGLQKDLASLIAGYITGVADVVGLDTREKELKAEAEKAQAAYKEIKERNVERIDNAIKEAKNTATQRFILQRLHVESGDVENKRKRKAKEKRF